MSNPYEKLPVQLRDLNIIPLIRGEKRPMIEWGKYTKEKYRLKIWEDIGNFAVICGETSNKLYVVDVDMPFFYERYLKDLDTFVVQTPGGGYHLYFFSEKQTPKREVKIRGFPIDILGVGSYCVCPPSEINGKKYVVVKDLPIKKSNVGNVLDLLPLPTQNPYEAKDFAYIKKYVDISDYVQKHGVIKEKEFQKGYWQGKCPFHSDEHPSFTVYPQTQSFFCFGCHRGGDVISFVSELNGGCGRERAIRILCDELKIPYPEGIEKVPTFVFFEERRDGRTKTVIDEDSLTSYLMEKFNPCRFENPPYLFVFDGRVYSSRGKDILEFEITKILKEQGVSDLLLINKMKNAIFEFINSNSFKRGDFTCSNVIVFRNGWLSLDDFNFHEGFDKNIYALHFFPFDYNPNANYLKILKFLNEVVEPENISLLQEITGYCLLRSNKFQRAFMLYGTGANGKSVFLNLLIALLGGRNVSNFSLQELNSNKFAPGCLFQKLANINNDIPKKPLDETGKFKQLVGGDYIQAEEKFKPAFNFQNTAKLIFASNELPFVSDNTMAFWRRWIVIPFPYIFEGTKANKNLINDLIQELPGFFNFALEGLKRLLKNDDFTVTKSVEEIKKIWLEHSNSVARFASKCIVLEARHHELKSEIYSKYIDFCKNEELMPVTERVFTEQFQRFAKTTKMRTKVDGKNVFVWCNIKYLEPSEKERIKEEQEEKGIKSLVEEDTIITSEEVFSERYKIDRSLEEKLKKEIKNYIDKLLDEGPKHINDLCVEVNKRFGNVTWEVFNIKEHIYNMKREGKYAEFQENVITKLY